MEKTSLTAEVPGSALQCTLSSRAFTLIELLIVIAIVAVLAALLLVSGNVLIDRAHAAACLSNLRQVASATRLYSGENNGAYPGMNVGNYPEGDCYLAGGATTGPLRLVQSGYVSDKRIFFCPAAKKPLWFSNWNNAWGEGPDEWHGTYVGYAYFAGYRLPDSNNPVNSLVAYRATDPGDRILAMDSCSGKPDTPGAQWNHTLKKPRGANVLFNDGSVSWRQANQMIERFTLSGRTYYW